MISKGKLITYSPIIWLIYFGILFAVYSSLLGLGSVDEVYLTKLDKSTEFMWRIMWGLFSISAILISTISIYCSVITIRANVTTYFESDKNKIYLGLLLCMLLIAILFTKLGVGGGAVVSLLKSAGAETSINVQLIVDVTMIIAAIAVFLISVSSTSILFRSKELTIDELKRKYSHFRVSFYVTSIFLGVGITQVYLLFTWASYATGNDPAAIRLAQALTVSGSIVYTLVFITLFVPSSIVLRTWLRNLASKQIDVGDDVKYIEWKNSVGLYYTPRKNVSDLFVLLSPVILGALANILSNYVSSSG